MFQIIKKVLLFYVKKIKIMRMNLIFWDYSNISKIIKDLLKYMEMKKYLIIFYLRI